MKLYTRSGDDGTTGLFGGDRVGKDHPRVEAYGAVDELNATIGVCRCACIGDDAAIGRIADVLGTIQSRLFDVGADLATPTDSPHASKIARVAAADVAAAEAWIDDVEAGNAPMRTFVLPGGTDLAARLHQARTVCRRAERRVVLLGRMADVNPHAVTFLNRIGDLLFAMARRANVAAGGPDVPWVPSRPTSP
ncbi:MAG: cob(I)yrinic acid a,c-diamide adenosyltransferase [Phycisphaerales bacterium]|nr:cob(I)yrinic acid a,c-diamide adenosyltransferase [Phycisphaerales bacterium]